MSRTTRNVLGAIGVLLVLALCMGAFGLTGFLAYRSGSQNAPAATTEKSVEQPPAPRQDSGLAPAAPVVGLLFGILIIVAALLLKKGKSPAGVIALALSAVLTAFSADLTLTAPALLAAAGGAVGLAKR